MDSRSATRHDAIRAVGAVGTVALVSLAYVRWLNVTNATTVALTFLLIVLIVAATSRRRVAVATSLAALLCFNFFFLPPVRTLTISDPQNWVALVTFLAVSLVASGLSSVARARAEEALARRDELARLFDLSCDVLLITDSRDALAALARAIARRFDLDYVAICLPDAGDWRVSEAGSLTLALDKGALSGVMDGLEAGPESHQPPREDPGHETIESEGQTVSLVPLRFGARPVGFLATAGRSVESGTLDALAGVAAIAMERAQFLEERKAAELSRQSEELKSALLASLAHDLRTPLTAIRIAAANLQASWLGEQDRRDQSALVLSEVERLTRLFQNVLEMARIDTGTIGSDLRWVHPSEIIEVARDQVAHTLGRHDVTVQIDSERLVRVDPRLTAAALAHVLENAAQYSPPASAILTTASITEGGLILTVRDQGPGISPGDLLHVFERFFRGAESKSRISGTGMGLSIAQGLLAAERGTIRAENCPDGGARFTIVIPSETMAPAMGDESAQRESA